MKYPSIFGRRATSFCAVTRCAWRFPAALLRASILISIRAKRSNSRTTLSPPATQFSTMRIILPRWFFQLCRRNSGVGWPGVWAGTTILPTKCGLSLSCGRRQHLGTKMSPNPARVKQHRSWPVSKYFVRTLLLILIVNNPCIISELSAQEARPSRIEFTNVTDAAGIKFVHFKGNKGISINREEFGPGVCVADFDGDGWQDIYFVNGRDLYNRGISVSNALYRNNRDGTFTDVTEKAGVPGTGYGLGCVWGAFDNDGFPDLFVTQYGRNVLYRNNGNGTFTDVTDKAGVAR